METPLVSIIIPCYNQGQFLAEAIESALGQSYPAREVLVIDDGSTDATAAVAARYAPHLRYLWQANGGLSAARNRGILEARGEFVLFLDADDYLAPDLLERHMAVAAGHREAAVLHGGWQAVTPEGQFLYLREAEVLPEDVLHTLLAGNRFVCHAVTVRRCALAAAGLFDTRLRACEDWDLWIRLAASGCRFASVSGAVAVYRQCPESMSSDCRRMWAMGLAVLDKNRGHHLRCGECRRALRTGRRWLRDWWIYRLAQRLRAERPDGWKWGCGLEVAAAAMAHPATALLLLEGALSWAVRRWSLGRARLRRGQGSRLMDLRNDHR